MLYFNKKSLYPWLVLILAIGLVFWQLGAIPAKLAFDELEFAKLALSLEGRWQIFSEQATGHATFYFYFLLTSVKIFGLNIWALRLPAAFFAVANSLLVFYLFKFYLKNNLSLIGTFIFITSHWVLNFGRYAFEATYLLFWELLALWLLINFLQKKSFFYWLGSLIATVMSFYSYLPGRIFWLLPLFLLKINRAKIKYQFWFLVGFFLLALPLLLASGTMENRVKELSYINQSLPLATKIQYFSQNVTKNLLMLNFKGDLNGRHNYPGKSGLNPFLGILFWYGLLIGLKNRKKLGLFWGWLLLSIIPSLFTYPNENPHFLRTYTLTVTLVFFISLALQKILKKWPNLTVWLILLVILSGIYEIRTYFKYQQTVFKQAFEKTEIDLKKLKMINDR